PEGDRARCPQGVPSVLVVVGDPDRRRKNRLETASAGGRDGQIAGALFGLGAAALFGVSIPFAKLLLPATGAVMLAALLYLGAGLGVTVLSTVLRDVRGGRESGLTRADTPLLLGIVLSGAVIGPVLLLVGLHRLSALAASLLLNLEAPFTILLAVWFFRDHVGEVEIVAILLIVAGALVLTSAAGEFSASWTGGAAGVGGRPRG